MKTDRIKLNLLSESGFRLDAAVHLNDGLMTKRMFIKKNIPVSKLADVTTDIFSGHRFKRYYVNKKEFGVEFLGGSDIQCTDLSNLKLISKKITPHIEDLYLEKDWILVTRSGTIGRTVFTNDNYVNKVGSEDLIRIIPDSNKILPGYLYTFLASKFGYSLLTQGTYGAVIQHIEPHHIAGLPIPVLPIDIQLKANNLIKEAAKLRVVANAYLKNATDFFDNKYQIFGSYNKMFTKNIKEIGFSWGVRNNDVQIEKLQKKILENNGIKLGQLSERIFAPPLFKHIYIKKDNGHPFFTGANLLKDFRNRERYLSPRGVKDIKSYKVSEGTILVYKSGPRDGMLGSTFYTDKTLDGACLSDHVIRVIVSDKINSNWIYAFLKSKIGLRILHNKATGTAILFITPERLSTVPIPKPDENKILINSWVEDFVKNFEDAHDKEFEAISLIEKEIESWQN